MGTKDEMSINLTQKTLARHAVTDPVEFTGFAFDDPDALALVENAKRGGYFDATQAFCDAVNDCTACPLAAERTGGPLAPSGPLSARVAFVTRTPGEAEIRANRYFPEDVPAGKVFASYLKGLGLSRDEVHLSAAAFCPPPQERGPYVSEVNACARYKPWELAMLPALQVVFPLGEDAARIFLGPEYSLKGHYGLTFVARKTPERPRDVYVVPLLHPHYLLQFRLEAPLLGRHLKAVRERLGGLFRG